jgi:hypothetical protein
MRDWMLRLGVSRATSSTAFMLRSISFSPENGVTATGTFCTFSTRRRAVTVTVSTPSRFDIVVSPGGVASAGASASAGSFGSAGGVVVSAGGVVASWP